MKSNPLRVLETLDAFLHAPFQLNIYERSALALGYPDAPARYHATMDVDAILPAKDVHAIEHNEDFWTAQERVNEKLGEIGLYFTHLFEDRQVILTPNWIDNIAPISGFGFRHLQLWRPSTPDLILTKMMRVDPEDQEDIEFLLRQRDVAPAAVRDALDRAIVPDVAEIAEAYALNRAWLLEQLNR